MVTHLRIVVATWLLLFIVMEDNKPVLSMTKRQTISDLETRIKALEEAVKCTPCSMIDEHTERLNKIEKQFAELKQPLCKFDFESGLAGWRKTGTAFDNQPTYGDNPTARNRGQPANQQGDWWIGGYEDRPSPSSTPGAVQGDRPQGTLTSPVFTITGEFITFLIGGGCDSNVVRAELIVFPEEKVARTTTGRCHESMNREQWHVSEFYGQRAVVRLVDHSSGGWGHINFDDMKGAFVCPQY